MTFLVPYTQVVEMFGTDIHCAMRMIPSINDSLTVGTDIEGIMCHIVDCWVSLPGRLN